MQTGNQSGLDIDLGNHCSQIAFNWAKKTFANRNGKVGEIAMKIDGAFANVMNFNGLKIGISSDGIGTKIELAERTGIYNTLGFDLTAMTIDDLVVGGLVPTSISNIIDVDVLDTQIIDDLMDGLHQAANTAQIAITGGEIAELGSRINGYGHRMHFNWCATAIGVLHPAIDNPIDGSALQEGDIVIALQSRGFRSNGFSAVRRIMQACFGDMWHTIPYDSNRSWGQVLLTPCLIYAPLIVSLLDEGIIPKGIAHITGGGIADNFRRVLKVNQLGVDLDNLFEPHDFMKNLQDMGHISNEQAYTWWNMGNGMLLVVSAADVLKTLAHIKNKEYNAKAAGKIIAEKTIRIKTADNQILTTLY